MPSGVRTSVIMLSGVMLGVLETKNLQKIPVVKKSFLGKNISTLAYLLESLVTKLKTSNIDKPKHLTFKMKKKLKCWYFYFLFCFGDGRFRICKNLRPML
jgi:hypothetical protein